MFRLAFSLKVLIASKLLIHIKNREAAKSQGVSPIYFLASSRPRGLCLIRYLGQSSLDADGGIEQLRDWAVVFGMIDQLVEFSFVQARNSGCQRQF